MLGEDYGIYYRNRYSTYYNMGKIYCTYTPPKPSQLEYLRRDGLMTMIMMFPHCYRVNFSGYAFWRENS